MGKLKVGPYTVPVGQNDMLALPRSQPLTLLSATYETQIYDDDLSHDIADVEVLDLRTSPTMFFVTAHDDAGAQIAFASASLSFSRSAGGVLSLFPSAGFGGFDPDVAPWNTITADAVVVGTNHCVVRVKGLAGVPIRWSAWIGIPGAQARA